MEEPRLSIGLRRNPEEDQMFSLRNTLNAGIAVLALGAATITLAPTPAFAFSFGGLGHMGGFGHMAGMGGFGHAGSLGHMSAGHGVSKFRGVNAGRTTGSHTSQASHSDKTASNKSRTNSASNTDHGTTSAKDADAKPKRNQTDNPPPQPVQQTTDNPPSQSVTQTTDSLPQRTTDRDLWTPRPGTPVLAQNFVEDLQDWWNNYTPVKLNCCYVKINKIGGVTFVYCGRRDSPAELQIAPECKKATCNLYVNGKAAADNDQQQVYSSTNTYSCHE